MIKINLAHFDTCGFDRLTAGLQCKVAGQFIVCSKMTLDDAAATDDPVMRCFDHLFEIVIGQHLGRQIASSAYDLGIGQSTSPAVCWRA